METKNIKIDVPEGWEIDKENSTFENIAIKKKEEQLSTKWEDFRQIEGWYTNSIGEVVHLIGTPSINNINTWPTKELAKASLALCQLIRYRDDWNKGWKLDWEDRDQIKYGIYNVKNEISAGLTISTQVVLCFYSSELRDRFMSTPELKRLLEIAKPLL